MVSLALKETEVTQVPPAQQEFRENPEQREILDLEVFQVVMVVPELLELWDLKVMLVFLEWELLEIKETLEPQEVRVCLDALESVVCLEKTDFLDLMACLGLRATPGREVLQELTVCRVDLEKRETLELSMHLLDHPDPLDLLCRALPELMLVLVS